MERPIKEASILGLGILLLLNPIYLSFLRETIGIGYVSSPILTQAGTVYVGIGIILVALQFIGSDLTFRWAVLASSGGFVVFLIYATTTGYDSFSLSAYLTEVMFWFPRIFLIALLFPLGFTAYRQQRLLVGIGMAVAIFAMFLDSFLPSSHGGFSGPLFAVVYTGAFTIGAFIVGYPLYYVGKTYQRRQQQNGSAT